MAEAQTRTRRSPRRPAAVNRRPEEGQETTLHDDIIDLFALKAKAAEAEANLKKAKAKVLDRMKASGETEVIVPRQGNRPGVKAVITAKTTNVIDPGKFLKAVGTEHFLECVSVAMGKAKDHLGQNRIDEITTSSKGADYVEVRALPKK